MVVSRVDFLHNIPKITTEKNSVHNVYHHLPSHLNSSFAYKAGIERTKKIYKRRSKNTNFIGEQVSGYKKINFVTLKRLFGIYKILEHIYSIHNSPERSPKKNKNHNIIHSEILLCTFLVFSKMLLVMLWSRSNSEERTFISYVFESRLERFARKSAIRTCRTSATSERTLKRHADVIRLKPLACSRNSKLRLSLSLSQHP